MSGDNMLEIKYCKRCGKVFNYKVSPYCPACIIKNDEDFLKCREYIEKNKYVTIKELAENTGVDEKIILNFLKEGRLSLEKGAGLVCENCGTPISQGRYCEKCFNELHKDLNYVKSELGDKKALDNQKKIARYSKSERMHIANRIIKPDKERGK